MPETRTTRPDLPFVGKVTLSGTLTTRTGLHVGAGGAGINPRGVDAPLIRDPMARRAAQPGQMADPLPYVPGSSLRGKLRMLLVRKLDKPIQEVAGAGGRAIRLHSCQDEACEVCRLFGSVPPLDLKKPEKQGEAAAPWSLSAALHVADLRLQAPQQFAQNELKGENALDRVTARSNPRQIERIPQGTSFILSFTYYVRRPDHLEEDLHNLLTTLSLLQDDTLGGHGSRGYGAVSVSLTQLKAHRFGLQEQEEQSKKYPLNLPLTEAKEEIDKVLSEVKAFLISLSKVTFPRPETSEAQGELIRRIACLRFSSPLHVGEPRVGLEGCVETVSSDTLFSALANAWATLYGKQSLEELLAEFCRAAKETSSSPPFLLSSAFPYLGEEFFLPKPFTRPPRVDEDQLESKSLKDSKFLPAYLFGQWIGGELQTADLDKSLKEEEEKRKKQKLSAKGILPRLRLDRLDLAANLYFCGQVYFPEDGGLYFLIEGKEKMLGQLHEALRLLGELGLGGERALGFGRFTVREWRKVEEVDALGFLRRDENHPDGIGAIVKNAFLTLSLYHPSQREMPVLRKILGDRETSNGYQLVERGGWVDSPELRSALRKKTCRLFAEGSVFQSEPRGCLIDVTPDKAPHQVYRYGFAFPVGIVLQ